MISKITYLVLGIVIGGGLSVAIADSKLGTVSPWWQNTYTEYSSIHPLLCRDQDANAKLDRILIGLDIQP